MFTETRSIRQRSVPWGKKQLAGAKEHFHNELVRNKNHQEYPGNDSGCQAGFKDRKHFACW